MKEILVTERSLPAAYHKALLELYYHGEESDCPDYNQKQKECSMTMVVEEPLAEPRISKCFIGGHTDLQQYVMEVLDGILDFKIGDGLAWEYTYHDRYIRQLPFVIEELKRNPWSRRAVLDIRDFAVDSTNTHPACWQNAQFMIRNGKLDMHVLMRSNDSAKATFMNAFAFISLQERIAKELCVEVGTYTHRANSFHCYENDFALLKQYVDGIVQGKSVTYKYEGFYKELMEESIPEILAKVEQVKEGMKL